MNLRRLIPLVCLLTSCAAAKAAGDAFDMNVLYIERTPRMAYNSSPETGGWPAAGSTVNWVAHVQLWGTTDVPSVNYRWVLDGEVVDSGAITNWTAGTRKTVTFPWTWEKVRHSLTFEVDYDRAVGGEGSTLTWNNAVTIDTDAISVGLWVEESLAQYFHENQLIWKDGANSWEDWAQRQIRFWNWMGRSAIYPTAPNGMWERIRLDQVIHVPNGALPLAGGLPTNNPDLRDKTVDLTWGFIWDNGANCGTGKFYDPTNKSSAFYLENSLIHELNHARYVIDAYGFDVHETSVAGVKGPSGNDMYPGPEMPKQLNWMPHLAKYGGLMSNTSPPYAEYDLYQWNRIAGQRARSGNCNAPGDIGVFLNTDLPLRNHVRFVDQTGAPVANAEVRLHTARSASGWYEKQYLNTPDAVYTSDANGVVTLPQNPFGNPYGSTTPRIYHTYGAANSVMLMSVWKDGVARTCLFEVTDFNIEYYTGHTQDAYYEVTLNFSPTNTAPGTQSRGFTSKITGRVIDRNGAGVTGAIVGVMPNSTVYAQADIDGYYTINARVGEPITLGAHRNTAATTIYPMSSRVTVVPQDGVVVTAPDIVLGEMVPNLLTNNVPVTMSPTISPWNRVQDTGNLASYLTDKNLSKRWACLEQPMGFISPYSPLILTLNLPAPLTLDIIQLQWTASWATDYEVQVAPGVSSGENEYKTVYATQGCTGGYRATQATTRGVDVIPFEPQPVGKIRVVLKSPMRQTSVISIYEIQAGLTLTANDMTRSLQIAGGLIPAVPYDIVILDIDKDGVVDTKDAVRIAQAVSGM